MSKGKMNLLAEYICPATCSDDQRLPDSLVVSRVTFPVNMPAAAGLCPVSIILWCIFLFGEEHLRIRIVCNAMFTQDGQ